MIHFEACIDAAGDPDRLRASVRNARLGGAGRIELCRDLAVGGLTPDPADIRVAQEAFGSGVMAMIRPRAGGFEYTRAEVGLMEQQIEQSAEVGADGVVFGLLDGRAVALDQTRSLTELAHRLGLTVTFHRAFDAVDDRPPAIDALVDLGVDRVLSSGTRWETDGTALDGADRLARLAEHADGRIEIVVGGGVTIANVRSILRKLARARRISVHAHSAVTTGGVVNATSVEQLVRMIQRS